MLPQEFQFDFNTRNLLQLQNSSEAVCI